MHKRPDNVKPDESEAANQDRAKTPMQQLAVYGDLALIMPSGVACGWIVGWLLDRWLGTHWIFLVGIVLGMIGGFVHIARTVGRAR